MMKKLIFALCLASIAATSMAKTATCKVVSGGHLEFQGKCNFQAEKGGSFSLSSLKKQGALYGDILFVNVYVVEAGVAEVRGLTRYGNNSRWGTAVRSKTQRACWEGSDFQICAW